MRSLEWILIPSDCCPYLKNILETDIQGECYVRMKTKIGVMLLQAKAHQRLPARYQKLGEGMKQILLHSS